MPKWEVDESYDVTRRPGYATVVPALPQPYEPPIPLATQPVRTGVIPLIPSPPSAISIILRAAGIPDGPPALAPAPSIRTRLPHVEIEYPPSVDYFTPPGPMGMSAPQAAQATAAPQAAMSPAVQPATPAGNWERSLPVMSGPSADVDRPPTPQPVNQDLFGRFLRFMVDANPITSAAPPDIKERALSIFRLQADRAWRDNTLAGTAVSNLESGINETPDALRRLPPGSVGPHNLMLRRPIGQQSNYMDFRPPDVQERLAERAERKRIAYQTNAAEKRDQMRALGPMSDADQAIALISSLFGSVLSPETFVGPTGAAYSRANTLGKMGLGAGVNAGVVGASDPVAQTEAVARGDRKEYSPTEHALATGGAAALGAIIPALGALARRFGAVREAPPVQPEAPRQSPETPPVRPAEPADPPSEKVGQPESKPQVDAPGDDVAIAEAQKLVKESLGRMDKRMGVPAEKPAAQPAIAEPPRAVSTEVKPVESAPYVAPGPAKEPAKLAVTDATTNVVQFGIQPERARELQRIGWKKATNSEKDFIFDRAQKDGQPITMEETLELLARGETPPVRETKPVTPRVANDPAYLPKRREPSPLALDKKTPAPESAPVLQQPTRAAEQPPDIPDFMRRPMPQKEKPAEPAAVPPAEAPRAEAPQPQRVEAPMGVGREGRIADHRYTRDTDKALKQLDPNNESVPFGGEINPPKAFGKFGDKMRRDMANGAREAMDVNRIVAYSPRGRLPYKTAVESGKPVVLFFPNGEARVFNLPKQKALPAPEKPPTGKITPDADAPRVGPEPVGGSPKPDTPDHPYSGEHADGLKEFNASFGLSHATAKAAGPEAVGAAVGGLVDHWQENGRFGFSPRGAVMGAIAVAALRHRIPGLGKSVVGKDSLATAGLKALGDAAASTRLGRQFHPTMGTERELWDKLTKLKVETRNFQDDALKIAAHIRKNTTPGERIAISDWIEQNDLSKHGSDAWMAADAKVRGLADAVSAHVDGLGERLVKVGMLDKQAFESLKGEYLHRYYLPKLAADDGFKQKAARMKASASYALRRGETVENAKLADGLKAGDQAVQWTHAKNGAVEYHAPGQSPGDEWFSSKIFKVERVDSDNKVMDLHRDYTPQERARMGEIRDGNFRFAMGSMEASRDLALGTLFKDIAGNAKWSAASDPGGWKKVPTTPVGEGSAIKKWGALAGKYVSPEVWSSLDIVRKPWSPDEIGFGAGLMNGYLKALGIWKVGKTAYNPATHFNNVMGNVSLSMLTGEVGPVHLMKAIGAFRRKDAVIEEARRAGLSLGREANLGDTFDGVRVDVGLASGLDDRGAWAKFADWYTNNMIVRAYQHEDAVFKLGAYMKRRAAGETPESAVANVHKVFFDYADVPLGVQAVRDFYSPFFTYTYKYAQVMMRELAERPHRFLAAYGALSAIDMMSYDWLYGDRAKAVSDYEREMAPKWLQGRSGFGAQKAIRMPWNEKDQKTGENRAMMLNTRYLIPGGDILDWVANGDYGPSIYPQALGNTILGGNPLINLGQSLMTGKDTFFGKPIMPYPDTNLWDFGKRPASEIAANWGAAIRFMATQALPPTLITAPDKLGQAATGEGAIPKGSQAAEFFGWTGTDFAGRQRSLARAVSSVLGVKIEDVAPDEAKRFREAELAKEVRTNLTNTRNLHRNQSTTETRKENAKDSLIDRIGRFREETRKMRDLQDKAGTR